MATILSRSRWTSTSPGGRRVTWSRIRGIVAHYPAMGRSVGVLSASQEASRLRGWRNYHVGTLGWSDIGYNYAIGQSGRIYTLRGDRNGGHAVGHNSTTLGVLFIVGDNEALTSAAKASFRALRTTLRKRGAGSGLWGHTEMSGNSTRCPGPYIMGAIRDGSLKGGSGGTGTAPKNDPDRPWLTSPRVNGFTEAEVREIQGILLGFDLDLGSYGQDGSYGDDTGKAVRTLQKELGVSPTDGIYGPTTQEAVMTIREDIDYIKRVTVRNQEKIDEGRDELDWVRRVTEVNQTRIGYVDNKVAHITRDGKPVSLRQEVADAKTISIANSDSLEAIERALAEADVDTSIPTSDA